MPGWFSTKLKISLSYLALTKSQSFKITFRPIFCSHSQTHIYSEIKNFWLANLGLGLTIIAGEVILRDQSKLLFVKLSWLLYTNKKDHWDSGIPRLPTNYTMWHFLVVFEINLDVFTTYCSSTTEYLNDFQFDLSRSFKVKSNGAFRLPIYMSSY